MHVFGLAVCWVVPNMVMKELAITMPKLLEEKLIKIKVKAETMALKEKNQARYFYAKLRDVRLEEELRKDKNRMYGIRKRISPNPNGSSSEFAAFAADDCSSMASGSTRAESVCDSRKSRTEIIEKLKTGSTRAESACDSRKSRTETIEKLKTEPIEKRGSVVRTRSTEKLKTELIEKRSSIVRTRSYKNMFDGQTSSRI